MPSKIKQNFTFLLLSGINKQKVFLSLSLYQQKCNRVTIHHESLFNVTMIFC
jgi:hypothetical protein